MSFELVDTCNGLTELPVSHTVELKKHTFGDVAVCLHYSRYEDIWMTFAERNGLFHHVHLHAMLKHADDQYRRDIVNIDAVLTAVREGEKLFASHVRH